MVWAGFNYHGPATTWARTSTESMNIFLQSTLQLPVFLALIHRHWFSFHSPFPVQPVLALVAGVLILVRPRFLNFIVAVYLIIIGLVGLFHLF